MTIEEKRKYVSNYCESVGCRNCACGEECTEIPNIIANMSENELDTMINKIPKSDSPDKEVEQELAECEGNAEMSREDKVQRLRSLNVQMIGEPSDEQIDEALAFYSDGYDTVERPKHYASTSIECIDAMRETQGVEAVKSFCVCNAFKYLWRHNNKNGDEDIRKASWYLNKAVELMGDKHDN